MNPLIQVSVLWALKIQFPGDLGQRPAPFPWNHHRLNSCPVHLDQTIERRFLPDDDSTAHEILFQGQVTEKLQGVGFPRSKTALQQDSFCR